MLRDYESREYYHKKKHYGFKEKKHNYNIQPEYTDFSENLCVHTGRRLLDEDLSTDDSIVSEDGEHNKIEEILILVVPWRKNKINKISKEYFIINLSEIHNLKNRI